MADKTIILHGNVFWCKLLGEPRENNFGEREWSTDLVPDKEGLATLKQLGLSDRIKDPKEGGAHTGKFIQFRQKELKADGTKSDPIRVVHADNAPWEKADGLIGNNTEVNLKFSFKDYGKGRKPGAYLRALQVCNLVPFVPVDFAPIESDEEFFANAEEGKLPEGMEPILDDDIPDFK